MGTSSSEVSKTRVLIADDERLIADTLRVIFQQEGFEVVTAYCGTTAVETARFWNPDVFLSDVLMPDMNGIEAAIRICKLLPRCRVLLLSGAGASYEMLDVAESRGYQFDLVLKPIHPTLLLDLVRNIHGEAGGEIVQR